MGLAASTLKIRNGLLKVFERTWKYGLSIRVSDVKSMMLKTWLAERRQEKSLKASGVNNYIRMLHGLFKIAVECGAAIESPAMVQPLLREESPERLTPTWEQANAIIGAVHGQNAKNLLSAMLLLGLGQAELRNLHGEYIDFERQQIIVRRQKTQRVFTIPIYPQAKPLLERFKAEGRITTGKPLFERPYPREALVRACRKLGLSPTYLGPCHLYGSFAAKKMENAWQYSKVYPQHYGVTASKHRSVVFSSPSAAPAGEGALQCGSASRRGERGSPLRRGDD